MLIPVHTGHHEHCLPLRFTSEGLILVLIVKVLTSLAITELIVVREVRDIVDVSLWNHLFPLLEVLVIVSYAFV